MGYGYRMPFRFVARHSYVVLSFVRFEKYTYPRNFYAKYPNYLLLLFL